MPTGSRGENNEESGGSSDGRVDDRDADGRHIIMSETISVTPTKVQFIAADDTNSAVNEVIQEARVELDPVARAVRILGQGREEKGSIVGDLIASARGVKITCGLEGDVKKSLHLSFSERSELDDLLERLQAAGLPVVRALDEDPEVRTASEAPTAGRTPPD